MPQSSSSRSSDCEVITCKSMSFTTVALCAPQSLSRVGVAGMARKATHNCRKRVAERALLKKANDSLLVPFHAGPRKKRFYFWALVGGVYHSLTKILGRRQLGISCGDYGRANMGEKKAGPRPFLTKIGGEFSFSDVFPASNSWPEMRNSGCF